MACGQVLELGVVRKEGFLNHYAGIKQVLTTNPVTTVKRMASDFVKHPGEHLANASTAGMYGKVKGNYTLAKSVVTKDAKTGGEIIGNTAANVADLAVGQQLEVLLVKE
ncbi:hypothetical protein QFZ20_002204 [Flavobacterium sp. W4I14]|nr:hypothetical protein [Flavobacterium sp. W4I14]